jgi:hypothetical protein
MDVERRDSKLEARVTGLEYNDRPRVVPVDNKAEFSWRSDRATLATLDQELKVGSRRTSAHYERNDDVTTITSDSRPRERRPGLVLLSLATQQGDLAIEIPPGQSPSPTVVPTRGTPVPTPTAQPGGSISIGDAACTAGSACRFTVTQSGGSGDVTVTYSTADATAAGVASCRDEATSTQDYVTAAGSVTVPRNGTRTISIATCGNTRTEAAETFSVNLTSATGGATIVDGQGVGTINSRRRAGD